jgi:tRNA (cytidine/uridine-2'-O-)-methyltransferase
MSLDIVLVYPKVPNNTGNIGRLCVATNSTLHLVDPLGFELTDKKLKRAGLDYWPHLTYHRHPSFEAFEQANAGENLVFFSSNVERPYWEVAFKENDFLVFGCEEIGLPADIIEANRERCFTIPLYNKKVRSLNLSNAVAIVLFEAMRQASK